MTALARAISRRRTFVVVVITAIAMLGVLAGRAGAVHDTGMFELDGTIADEPDSSMPYDFGSLFDSNGNRKPAATPDLTNGPLLASTFIPDAANPDSTYFGSNKDTDPINTGALTQWTCIPKNNPTFKDDLENAYAALIQIPATAPDNAGDTVLYVGSERVGNNGDSFAGFWLLKDPNVGCTSATVGGSGVFTGAHTDGDLLIVTNFINGGAPQNVNVYEWTGGPSGGPVLMLSMNGGVCGETTADVSCSIANTVTQTSPWAPTSHPADTFGEAGVDLTTLYGSAGACFATFLAETLSSQQLSGTLNDFAGGSSDGGQFNTCPPPPVTSTVVTSTGGSTVDPGTGVHDVATVSAAGSRAAPTGTVTFNLCSPGQVTGAGCPPGSGTQVGSPVTINAGSATSTPDVTGLSTPNDLALGTYCWSASYTPDSASAGVYLPSFHTDASSECFTVKALSSTASAPSGTSLTFGQSLTDSAVVTGNAGGPAPTGTVSFYVCGPSATTLTGCVSTANQVGSAVVLSADLDPSKADATSASFTPSAPGNYCFYAVYNDDGNYSGSADGSSSECFTVGNPITTGQILPAQTTCRQYLAGATTLPAVDYRVKGTTINNVSPRLLFYYNQVTAPSATFNVDVTQAITSGNFKTLFGTMQVLFYNGSCNTYKSITVNKTNPANAVIHVTGATTGALFAFSVKYNSGTVVGQKLPSPTTVNYSFATNLNGGATLPDSTAGISLKTKP